MSKKKYYDSETGDVMGDDEVQGVPAIEPLRIPGILDELVGEYIPAVSEKHADEVWPIGLLREKLSAWLVFGTKTDVLQEYLDQLNDLGYRLQDTTSGPALCLIRKSSGRMVNEIYDDAEEL